MTENNIPKNWQEKKLGEVFTIERGGSPRPIEEYITDNGNGINWIKIGDTKNVVKYIFQTKEKIKPEGVKRSRMVYVDDFILSNSMSFGKPFIMKTTGCIHDGWLVIRKNDNIDNNYLYHILSSPIVYQQFSNLAKGSTVKNLNIEAVKQVIIKYPPLSKQLAIVSKIEELLSDLENGKQQLLTAQQQLKVYRQSLLKAAFEGKLSNKGVKEGELPKGWKRLKIGDVCKCIVPNRDKPKSFSGDIKWVTTPNLVQGSIKINYNSISLGLSEVEAKEYNARIIPIGSVIMTCVGTFGLSAIVEKQIVINQQLHAFLSSDLVKAKYLAYCIQYNKTYFENKSTSTTIQYLNKTNCNSMPLPLCSLDEQKQIIDELECKLTVCDKIEETIKEALLKSESLRQSILKKAFRGQLI